MPSDPQGTTPTTYGRSPSPGEKRRASEIVDSEPEGGVSMGARDGEGETSPSIDEQIGQVNTLTMQPVENDQKGFVISMTWLKKIFARSSQHADKADKDSLDSELGPVDNSDIVLDLGPAERNLKDERGEQFVPLRPGLQLGEDYEIVPQEGWDLITKWHGLAPQSPVIVRYAHGSSLDDSQSNIMYELNPPIFTIFKLSNPSAGTSPQLLREKNLAPAKILTGRQTNFQKWLKEAKELVKIDMSTKVRVWKIINGLPSANPSAATTPTISRAASPAPGTSALISNSHKSLLVDLHAFLSLSEGSQRQLLQDIKDQTNNPNYNGRMSLHMAGLLGTDVIVLEEQVGKGEWVSEASVKTLKQLGIPVEKPKQEVATSSSKSPVASGRSSPDSNRPSGRKPSGHRLGLTGLSNLGNTCYMNAATQCVRAIEELSIYFLQNAHKTDLNFQNPLGYNGELAKAYSNLLHNIYREPPPSCYTPSQFRSRVGRCNPTMSGWEQQDSQEFLLFLLDGLSEDLNRILKKPYIEKPDSTDEMVHDRRALEEFAAQSWDIYKARNDSVITDLFAGMYKSTVVCPDCEKVSIMFDPFSSLTLPIPSTSLPVCREVIFMPLATPPIKFMVEVEKETTVRAWKRAIAEQRGVDPERVIGAEISSNAFWHIFDDDETYHELRLKPADPVLFIELEHPATDRVLVPVFHRKISTFKTNKNRPRRDLFALPSILSFTHQEIQDAGAIYSKLLRLASTMTTLDILGEDISEDDEEAQEDSDTVVMNDDDAKSADSRIKTSSVEGDDSIVDVSMHDASSAAGAEDTDGADETPSHPLAGSIPPQLLSLFEVRVLTDKKGRIPTGRPHDPSKQYPLLTSRLRHKPSKLEQGSRGSVDDNSDGYSDTDDSDDGSQGSADHPLIRPREGIFLDWDEEKRLKLFGGADQGVGRGESTYSHIQFIFDKELTNRRAEREAKTKEGIALDQCLNEFRKDEILSQNDAWYCPRCKEHRQARKKFELWSAPDIVVIHLKRFTQTSRWSRSKLDTLVRFPLQDLDLSGHISGPSDGKTLMYDLVGVDNHMGGMGGGHYTAYAKNFITGDWCEFNDSSARVVRNPERIITPAAYLLFYRRKSSEPLGGAYLQNLVNAHRQGVEPQAVESRRPSPSPERNAVNTFEQPSWSFDRNTNADEDDQNGDLFGDNESTAAVEDGSSEPEERLRAFDNSRPSSAQDAAFEDVPPLLEDGSDDELPVVELRVGEEEKN
ncbi:hypothetical protein N7492_003130 [Penicillium capsulatum]|uniref:ubiquitinyl hydrolase 1 n=1 Tax=Penicillium capsulatum TaxID=69766 RepID=A0A9W9LWB3_9EURO|nr:hypothetical protein N7492_003130 [Penicillium capsulatum]